MKLHRLYPILALTASMTLRSGAQTDDLAPMSEEFSTSGALANFQRLYQTEGWGADQLVSAEIEPGEGRLVMIPRASSWYQDYKGPLAYKTVSGDFVATTDVSVRNNAGTGAPGVPYSFGGLLIRAPRPDVDSPGSWLPGREDWVIHAVGTAGSVGVPAYEEKTTDASVTLPSFPGGSERAVVRIARIGQAVVLLRRPNGGEWTVARRYRRADLPATLQVGLTAYGNFNAASAVSPLVHNQTVLAGASADLVARFDYFRLRRPLVPAALQGLDMADAAAVSDTQLLSFLAEPAPEPPVENDDITRLDDEFEDASSITNWSRVYQAEGWGFDQLERWEVNQIDPGRMTMIPHASSWYQEWRGVQAYKAVTGDFVVTTDVEPTSRSGTGAPNVNYSLAGIMVRRPRPEITAGRVDWTPNGENYIFLSMGAASDPGTPQFEVKTTLNSDSNLEVSPGGARARLQIARVGQVFIVLRQIDNQPWQVHRRYTRADLPETLHVGLTTYTDWDTCNAVGHEFHNTNLLVGSVAVPGGGNRPAQPDLIARFDYVRFRRPAVPSGLQGRNLANPSEVSDAELLGFLAAHANQRGSGTNEPAVAPSIVSQPVSLSVNHGGNAVFALEVEGTAPIYYQWLRSGTNLIAETNSILTVTGVGAGDAG
ncbi:MAG: hypothetical protein ISQ14_14985, partial [Verrucomicrobiae bacterium]|nr:hypothetical protein [Verrucomicrobiae bacterium]